MKLLHVAPSVARSYGGPTQSLVGFVQAAQHRDSSCVIAAPQCSANDAEWLAAKLPGVDIHLFDTHGGGAFVYSRALLNWVRSACRDFDVVHVHGTLNPISSLVARTALRAGAPTIIRPFGTLSRYTFAHRRRRLKTAYFSALDRPNLQRSTLHFTTTSEMEEARWHGIDFGNRAHVVPPSFAQAVSPARRRTTGGRQRTLLFLSRIDPVKNIEALLGAWAIVQSQAPGAVLKIAGGGDQDYVDNLRALALRLGIEPSVCFLGFTSGAEKEALLGAADAFVLPSRHENFGMAVLEAIGVGLPVVISPEVQLAPFVLAHGLGSVVHPDPQALARVLLATLEDEALRDRCAERGPTLVSQHFSPERIGEQLHVMYDAARAIASGSAGA